MTSSPSSPAPLAGRRVAITGASRGIGAALAHGLADLGAAVALLYRPASGTSASALAAARQIVARGGRAAAIPADVADPAGIESAFAAAAAELGAIDVLVNNAAVSRVEPWDATSVEQWDALMAVNVRGAWLCARAVAPAMRAAGWGRIVNVGSIEVQLGGGDALAYVTSKAALTGLTRGLAQALGGDGICVNAVLPGAIKTEAVAESFGDTAENDRFWIERQCVPRRGLPDDLVGLFAFLASPASDFVTGQLLTVDGGATFG